VFAIILFLLWAFVMMSDPFSIPAQDRSDENPALLPSDGQLDAIESAHTSPFDGAVIRDEVMSSTDGETLGLSSGEASGSETSGSVVPGPVTGDSVMPNPVTNDSVISNPVTPAPVVPGPVIPGPAADISCPIALPQPHGPISYRHGVYTEAWSTQSESSIQEYARDILYVLYEMGTVLVEAGYLDLFGNNWGCVAQSERIGVLTLTIKVTRSTAPTFSGFPGSSNTNILEVSIVRTLPPELAP